MEGRQPVNDGALAEGAASAAVWSGDGAAMGEYDMLASVRVEAT